MEAGVNAGARGRMEVSLRDVTIVRDERGRQSAGDVMHRKRAEVGENLKKVRELKLDAGRRRSTFGARWGETNLRAVGAARDGGQMNMTA